MHRYAVLCLTLAALLICLPACAAQGDRFAGTSGGASSGVRTGSTGADSADAGDAQTEGEEEPMNRKLTVAVGTREFSVVLYASAASEALAELLPLTAEMSDMPHEKYVYLPQSLPTDAQRVGRIEAGDLMLWGDNCLVLFYESFDTSYSYTRLGKIEDVGGLAEALGSGSVTVSFAVSEG